jgi:myo-inositol 2-dehydrogenase/D-chiro-inositol 1-dehydrogenase
MSIHDMDLCRWFTGGQEPKKLWAIGGQFEFPQYKEWDDGDNVSVTIQYEDDTMAFLFANRVAAHGSHVETELIGTKGAIRIGAVGTDTMNEYYTENGVCREVYDNFVDRWHQAYINELEDFVDAIITNRTPEATVYDGTATLNTAFQCKESFIKNELIDYKKA